MAKDRTWEEAISEVLCHADTALHYSEIADQILAAKLKRSVGATPANTVASILSSSLSGKKSPFLRLGKGLYTVKEKSIPTQDLVEENISVKVSENTDTGALRAFGMFWRRDHVGWSGPPRLLGRQGLGAVEVNFASQVGAYLLHDRERVIYVGRASDTLYARIKAHTTDRLGGRWDRFSWFGLKDVSDQGELEAPADAWTHISVVETIEALLIESLEPPLNRKRGDNFSSAEYLQVPDPELTKQSKKQILAEMAKTMGLSE